MRPGRPDLRPLRPVALGLAAILLASFWCCGHGSRAQSTATVRIEPPLVELPAGETATVSILVEDVTDLYCFELQVGFDPAKIQVVDADPDAAGVQIADGDFLSVDWKLRNAVDNEEGTVAYALCQLNPSEPRSGSGVLATITWRARAQGNSPVDLHDLILAAPLGAEISADVQDGEIVARSVQPAPGGTATPYPTPTPTPTSPRPSSTPTEQALPSPGADEAATPDPTPTASATPTNIGTPIARDVTREPTATATAGGTTATISAGPPQPSATPSPTETPAAVSMETPTRTTTLSETAHTIEPTASETMPVPSGGTRQGQPPHSGLLGLSSRVWLVIAVGCLILGSGALIFASVLWRRKEP